MTNEEIIEKQANQIEGLQKELINLKSKSVDCVDRKIVYNLQEEIFQMHSKIGELYRENEQLRGHLNTILNSKSWKATQGFRNVLWKMKGSK